MRRLRDSDIRQAAYRRLLTHARACPDTLVIDELGLDHGNCRIDIAVINGHIRGVEIKAEADTLERLPRQVAAYGEVVDKALLIVDPKHLASAMTMVPDWWGIMVAERGATQGVRFRRVRPERANKGIDPLILARLLWRPEAQAILRSLGVSERELRAPRATLDRVEILYHLGLPSTHMIAIKLLNDGKLYMGGWVMSMLVAS